MANEVITPEVVKDSKRSKELETRTQRIRDLQDRIERHLRAFATNVVVCGFDLLAVKKQVGHGKWQDYFEKHLQTERFGYRHAARYMAVAKAAKKKMQDRQLIEDTDRLLTGEVTAKDDKAIRDALADMTDATTWQQLMLDFGLLRQPKPLGGAREPKDEKSWDQRRAEGRQRYWQEHIVDLHKEAVDKKSYMHLTKQQAADLLELLIDIRKALKEVTG